MWESGREFVPLGLTQSKKFAPMMKRHGKKKQDEKRRSSENLSALAATQTTYGVACTPVNRTMPDPKNLILVWDPIPESFWSSTFQI
jgi:hypothetical protein